MKIFDFIDSKNKCPSIFVDGKINKTPNFPEISKNKSITWMFKKPLKNIKNVDFVGLFTNGKTIEEFCPEYLQKDFQECVQKHRSFLKVFKTIKIKLNDVCFYDVVPESFVVEFFQIKIEIMKHIWETVSKPKNYDHYLVGLSEIIDDISTRKIKIDLSSLVLDTTNIRMKSLYQKLQSVKPFINYNLFGTKTGRLTTKKHSFPILNLDKFARKVIKPTNDFLLELDFNSSELRTFLALAGNEQPQEDIHLWHQKQFNSIYGNEGISRDQAKERVLSWLFNGHKGHSVGIPVIEKMYNKKKVLDQFWNGEFIETPFGKKIASDEFHAISYVVQTTNAEVFYKQMIKVYHLLENKKSFVKWLLHDAAVIDLAECDLSLVKDITRIFGQTDFGQYLVNVKLGKDFGNMRKVDLK